LVRTYKGRKAAQDFTKEAGQLAYYGFEVSAQSGFNQHPGMALVMGTGNRLVVTYTRVKKS
jgi:hypothetical protein